MAYLRNFPENELIFNEDETRQILKFFFPNDKDFIDRLIVNYKVGNFAQGVLVEAVDASYKYGYVDVIYQSISSFITSRKLSKSYVDFMKTLARKGMKHWFKHATHVDLMRVQIYDYVRATIQRNFRINLNDLAQTEARVKGRSIRVAYAPDSYDRGTSRIIWR